MKEYYDELVASLKNKKLDKKKLNGLKIRLCKKHGLKKIPTDIEVLLNVKKSDMAKVKKYLLSKPTRTISGVSVVAIMTKPLPCPHANSGGPCAMCPGGVDSVFGSVPQSYTGKEPATRRAIRNKYDPYLQVMNRLEQYAVQGHIPDKVELILMGGTFPSFPSKYKQDFVKYSIKAMNDFSRMFFDKGEFDVIKFKEFFELPANLDDKARLKRIHHKLLKAKGKTNLNTVQNANEKSKVRCVGMTIETRPDYSMLKHANDMLKLGCTRVELGVQTIYDSVLRNIKRGHTVEDSIKATAVLKDLGFKINYHVMLGLPGVSKEMDEYAFLNYFKNEEFMPDMLKIYPCMVMKGTKLYSLWKEKKFKPLTTKKAALLIAELKQHVPEWCRIMRVQRDIPTFMTSAGVDRTNLRQYIDKVMKEKGYHCRCIRCREPKLSAPSKKIVMKVAHYGASSGNEFFISVEDEKNDTILGFCRLRFPHKFLRKEITEDSALIRELHVFGPSVQIGKKGSVQHKGIGKRLLAKAEDIAKSYYKNKIVVISGIGARDYYRKLGYKREGVYMVKNI